MFHQRALPRYELEDLISDLSFSYPKCFFTEPGQKRPLKNNIIIDLEKDSMRGDDKLNAALTFYTRDWNYENKLQAGAKRIDLDGNEVGTVTETEAREARERVRVAKEAKAAKEAVAKHEEKNNVAVVTLPPQRVVPTPMPTIKPGVPTTKVPTPEPMARLCNLVVNIERISKSTDDAMLREALIVAALQVLIMEATQFVETLKRTTSRNASENSRSQYQ